MKKNIIIYLCIFLAILILRVGNYLMIQKQLVSENASRITYEEIISTERTEEDVDEN